MAIFVDQDLCRGCGICVRACPNHAILMKNGKAFVDQTRCSQCQACVRVCPTGALYVSNTNALVRIENEKESDVIYFENTGALASQSASQQINPIPVQEQPVIPRIADFLTSILKEGITALSNQQIGMPGTPSGFGGKMLGRHRRLRKGGNKFR